MEWFIRTSKLIPKRKRYLRLLKQSSHINNSIAFPRKHNEVAEMEEGHEK
jgi:hypothetical protein